MKPLRVPADFVPGIFSDDTSFSFPAVWRSGSNVRPYMGRMQTIGGWSLAFSTALTGVCRSARAWVDNDSYENIAFGTHSALMVYKGGELFDITPSGLAAGAIDGAGGPGYGAGDYGEGDYGESVLTGWYARTWSMDNYGQSLIANARGETIHVWDNDTGTPATAVTNAPANVNSILVTPQRILMALGCNEEISGDLNPMCIRWSDSEDITDWTTAADNLAGEYILEGGGRIVGSRKVGEIGAIWTDSALHVWQYNGDPNQVFRFDLVADNCGLAGPNAVTVFNQTAFWVTPDLQIYAWTPGSPPAPMKCPLRRDFAANMVTTQLEKIVATPVSEFSEVWFFYPDARDGVENSRYIAVSTVADQRVGFPWFEGQLARTAALDSGPTRWPMFIAYDGYAYWHENGNSANGGTLDWSISSSDMYLDQAERRVLVRGVWPDFLDQTGAISLTVSVRSYPQATATDKGPYMLETGRSKKDFFADGRIATLTFSGSSAPAFMRLGKPSFDVVPTGQQ